MTKSKSKKLLRKFNRVEDGIASSNVKAELKNSQFSINTRPLSVNEQSFLKILNDNFSFCSFITEYELVFTHLTIEREDLQNCLRVFKNLKQAMIKYSLIENVHSIRINISGEKSRLLLTTELVFEGSFLPKNEEFVRELLRSNFTFVKGHNGIGNCKLESRKNSNQFIITHLCEFEFESILNKKIPSKNESRETTIFNKRKENVV